MRFRPLCAALALALVVFSSGCCGIRDRMRECRCRRLCRPMCRPVCRPVCCEPACVPCCPPAVDCCYPEPFLSGH